ncbi:MAG TPA: hypothetical protein PKD86_09140 [Gemmatales bacterium]|nr:hypothetical protein [Gemmatales bacterium]HMP59503.1 hypothetical protein [Gemmatales bacterium]
MYPLKVALVGCGADLLPYVQNELIELGAEVAFDLPDVKSAIGRIPSSAEEKRLFILHLNQADGLGMLERLSDHFAGWPILVLTGLTPTPEWLLTLMRAGAAQIVPLPAAPGSLKPAFDRLSKQFGFAASTSRVVAVSGVSEGCGATTLAINLAYELAHIFKQPTVLTEMSLQLGRLASYLDLRPRFTTQDLLGDMERVEVGMLKQILTPHSDNLHVLPGPYQTIAKPVGTPSAMANLLGLLRRVASVVVIDMPYTFDEMYFTALQQATHVVLVAQQSVPAVQSLAMLRDAFDRRDVGAKQCLVLNRFDPKAKDLTEERIREVVHGPPFLLAPDDHHVTDAINRGKLLREVAPHSKLLAALHTLGGQVLDKPEFAPAQPGQPSYFGRLLRGIGIS